MKTFSNLRAAVGQVITEQPYVKLLTEPKLEEYEIPCELRGLYLSRWTALANVNGALCFVELRITQQQEN